MILDLCAGSYRQQRENHTGRTASRPFEYLL